jgi:hypothetical protein
MGEGVALQFLQVTFLDADLLKLVYSVPDPGSGAVLTLGSVMGKNQDLDPG